MTDYGKSRWFGWVLVTVVTIFAGCAGSSPYLHRIEQVELISYHRMYPAYRETTLVAPGERVTIGDQDYTIELQEFLPDFQMDTAGVAYSRSDSLGNPALKVGVLRGGKTVATEWAFEGEGPPHFRQTSLFGFRIRTLRMKVQEPDSTGGER